MCSGDGPGIWYIASHGTRRKESGAYFGELEPLSSSNPSVLGRLNSCLKPSANNDMWLTMTSLDIWTVGCVLCAMLILWICFCYWGLPNRSSQEFHEGHLSDLSQPTQARLGSQPNIHSGIATQAAAPTTTTTTTTAAAGMRELDVDQFLAALRRPSQAQLQHYDRRHPRVTWASEGRRPNVQVQSDGAEEPPPSYEECMRKGYSNTSTNQQQ